MVVLLFTIGLIAYQWTREFVVIRVEEGLHRASLPQIAFESSSPTKIDACSGQSIDRFESWAKAIADFLFGMFRNTVMVRPDSLFTIHSRALTQEQIESLHSITALSLTHTNREICFATGRKRPEGVGVDEQFDGLEFITFRCIELRQEFSVVRVHRSSLALQNC